jgi:hypothetical protein
MQKRNTGFKIANKYTFDKHCSVFRAKGIFSKPFRVSLAIGVDQLLTSHSVVRPDEVARVAPIRLFDNLLKSRDQLFFNKYWVYGLEFADYFLYFLVIIDDLDRFVVLQVKPDLSVVIEIGAWNGKLHSVLVAAFYLRPGLFFGRTIEAFLFLFLNTWRLELVYLFFLLRGISIRSLMF